MGAGKRLVSKLGIFRELLVFLWKRKLWWMIPMMVMLILFAMLLVFAQGSAVAPFLVSIVISVIVGVLAFRQYVAPGINEALEEAQTTITNLAKLSGVKSQEYKDMKGIEKVVAEDLIKSKIPELEALRLILSPSAWEQVEDSIAENPEAVIQLYEKYGHLLGGTSQKQIEYDL